MLVSYPAATRENNSYLEETLMQSFYKASFFSYVAFADLRENLDLLKQHGVDVEFHPVLIAGINNLSGLSSCPRASMNSSP